MALVLIEGFDHLLPADYGNKGTGWVVTPSSTPAGRFGGLCAAINGNSSSRRAKLLPSTYSTLYCGFAILFTQGAPVSSLSFFQILSGSGATVQLNLLCDASGHLQVTNNGGTVIATGTTTLLADTWYYIEVKVVINGASGNVTVKLNGASEIAQTTGNFGSTNVDTIGWSRWRTTTTALVVQQIDDVYCLDTTGSAPRNDFLGDVRVATIYPTSDGAHTQWTPSSGSNHYDRVNETQADGDTTYVSDSTANDIDTYGFGDIDTLATVYGLQVSLYARKDDANTRQIAPVIRQSGTDYVGTTQTLTASYATPTQIYNQDPTSADWTAANVNADEFGVKEIA